jgi:N utilization substance protein B
MQLTKAEQRVRRRARVRALQAVYAWDVTGAADLLVAADRLWDDLALTPELRRLAGTLVRTLAAHLEPIDRTLTELTANWRLERLGAVERSVLRLGSAELMLEDVPPRVAIREALHLTERFATPDSARFVNGVLDAVARARGRL